MSEGNDDIGITSQLPSPKPDLSVAIGLVYLGCDRMETETSGAIERRAFLFVQRPLDDMPARVYEAARGYHRSVIASRSSSMIEEIRLDGSVNRRSR